MNDEAVPRPRGALARRFLGAAEVAEAGRPGERHDVVIERRGRRRRRRTRQGRGPAEPIDSARSAALANRLRRTAPAPRAKSVARLEAVFDRMGLPEPALEDRPQDPASGFVGVLAIETDDAPLDPQLMPMMPPAATTL